MRQAVEGQGLAHVSQHDGQVGIAIEQPAEHEAQEMAGRLDVPAPDRALHLRLVAQDVGLPVRIGRVDVDRRADLGGALPERQIARVVQVDAVRVTVDHRAHEAEIVDAPLQLVGGRLRVLHRQHREPAVALRVALDLRLQIVVRAVRVFDGAPGVRLGLYSRARLR